ncbi:hypothetical protein EJ03DRAFT_332039 [Teratosphaeria nubilosa]|uniref:Uncharacterized protein n=1 Tax=Teratosphaeria nubilosa TaxID=161662 RepID=A0A6G1KW00_9PEZI|nr:hypothetical protein EJ03DRAFT_332039 [Teratosphaeria nubilosa]
MRFFARCRTVRLLLVSPETPVKLSEKSCDNLVITGFMSQAYGLAGSSIGWVVTKHKSSC